MLNKKEVERQRLVALGNVTNHGLKKSYEDFMLERRESDLIEYVDNMVHTAERTLRELKDYQRKVNDESYTDNTGKEKVVQWAMNYVQQGNWHFDCGADVCGKYVEAKVKKELAKKKEQG